MYNICIMYVKYIYINTYIAKCIIALFVTLKMVKLRSLTSCNYGNECVYA